MYKSMKFRIYPTHTQAVSIQKHFWAVRWIYNYGLNVKIENHQKGIKTKRYDIQVMLPWLKKQYPWLAEVYAQSIQKALLDLNAAYTNFFRSHAKFPKFKSKKDNHKSYSYPQGIIIVDWKIRLPKVWLVRIIQHRPLLGKIKTCTVSQTPTGKYYVSILQDDWLEAPAIVEATKDKCVGIDLGIKDFAICSNGKVYDNPKWMKSYQRRLEIRQRRHSRKQKGSSNKNKSRLLMAAIHEKVSNQRMDYIHKITHDIVSDNQATNYAIENLNTKGIMKNHRLAEAIGQVWRGMFVNTLKYKAALSWKSVLEIWQFEPSSKMCSKCWNIKSDLKLSDRIYKCDKCWLEIDRDLQASINIKNFAYK